MSLPRNVEIQDQGPAPGGRKANTHRAESRKRAADLFGDSRGWSLEIAAREYVWLWDERHGQSVREIAAREGVTISRVRFGLRRARAQEKAAPLAATRKDSRKAPRLVPLFPIGPFTPTSTCGHTRPIEAGSSFCCMVCHGSGMDSHPAVQRDPRQEPLPEPKAPEPEPINPGVETRRQKRKRIFQV